MSYKVKYKGWDERDAEVIIANSPRHARRLFVKKYWKIAPQEIEVSCLVERKA